MRDKPLACKLRMGFLSSCTHPLVWLPLLCILAASVALGIGDWCSICALVPGIVAMAVAAGLTCTWLMGHPCCHDTRKASYFIDTLALPCGGQVLMSHAPGSRRTWQPNLVEDLGAVQRLKATCVVTLLASEELETLGLQELGVAVEAAGMDWHYCELRDKWIPWNSEVYLKEMVLPLVQRLQNKETILVHCSGGKGRTGTLVGALLMTSAGGHLSLPAAISAMRAARPGMLKNPLQQLFLLHLQSSLATM
ncbi:Elongation factor 3B [Durusdinium trenchii]|uniref:Elongation factor 3B n=3 Tax=Durusdinium trenchii TaxID=1381693 RepID=A0ABP0KMS5_9DINO